MFDGHGGNATSDWLENEMYYEVQDKWDNGKAPQKAINKAFRVADSKLLQPSGFMGMGERGIGGSKCGSTAAVAFVYQVRRTGRYRAMKISTAGFYWPVLGSAVHACRMSVQIRSATRTTCR